MKNDWIEVKLNEACGVHDNLRKPINTTERNKRIKDKPISKLYPYYGATGQVGYIDDYITNGEFILLGEDGAPFLDYTKNVAYLIQGKTWVNNHAHVLLSHFNNKFLLHYLNSFNYKNYVSGTTRLKLTQGSLKQMPVKIAPLPEQRAIVGKIEKLFSDIDNGVANLKAAKDKLEIYRQAVLKKAFEGEFTRPHEITWITLGEICDDVQYGTSSKSLEKGEIPVIRMGNIQNGKIDWSDLVYTNDKNEIEKYKLYYNDVLFNRTNSPELVGKTAIYKGEFPAIFAGYLIRINYKKSEVNPDYLTYFLNCHIAKKYGNKIKSDGVNQSNINGTKLKQYPFPNTKLEVQKQIITEIETRLSVCDNILGTIDEALEKSEALRQSILKKAFEGRLLSQAELEACRKESDWEPADKLLERIKQEKDNSLRLRSENIENRVVEQCPKARKGKYGK